MHDSAKTISTLEFIGAGPRTRRAVVVGQDVVVERLLIALFTGGHLLLQGVPGLAKTLLVSAISKTIDLDFARIQFTIDLLPSDILGSEILDQRTSEFRTAQGADLHQPAAGRRDQPRRAEGAGRAARGDAGAQGHDRQRDLPAAGAVPGDRDAEPGRAGRHLRAARGAARPLHAVPPPRLPDARGGGGGPAAQRCSSGLQREGKGAVVQTEFDVLERGAGRLGRRAGRGDGGGQRACTSARSSSSTWSSWSTARATTRASSSAAARAPGIALVKASRARALIHGRDYVIPEDLFALAEDVILHRIRLTYEALAEGLSGRDVLRELLSEMG